MELNNFIKQVLIDIKKGIKEANNENGEEIFRIQNGNESDIIEFDVAVTVEYQKQDSCGASIGIISVLGISLGGKKETVNSNITVSRIKFKVTCLLIK